MSKTKSDKGQITLIIDWRDKVPPLGYKIKFELPHKSKNKESSNRSHLFSLNFVGVLWWFLEKRRIVTGKCVFL